jgi:YfiH family protein
MGALITGCENPIIALMPFKFPGVRAAFLGRTGGYSCGPYASLNLAQWTGDETSAVERNWQRLAENFDLSRIVRLRQIHSAIVRTIKADDNAVNDGDGMVTAAAGVTLAIFTADCVPILMLDRERRLCGALHAGWRGTLAGIAEQGVRAMLALGARPDHINAALGPGIGSCCFEVDAALARCFTEKIPAAARHVRDGSPGKAFLSLRAILREQLEQCGLRREQILTVGPCTKCASDRFFSRRAAQGAVTGLQMSFIGFD